MEFAPRHGRVFLPGRGSRSYSLGKRHGHNCLRGGWTGRNSWRSQFHTAGMTTFVPDMQSENAIRSLLKNIGRMMKKASPKEGILLLAEQARLTSDLKKAAEAKRKRLEKELAELQANKSQANG